MKILSHLKIYSDFEPLSNFISTHAKKSNATHEGPFSKGSTQLCDKIQKVKKSNSNVKILFQEKKTENINRRYKNNNDYTTIYSIKIKNVFTVF